MALTKVNASNIVDGVLPVANGGTGATTQAGAAAAVLPSQTGQAGKYLATDGANTSWSTVSITPAAVSDQTNTSTGYFDLPSGTTAQRPASPTAGAIRFNTSTGSVEFYDGATWISTNLIPVVNSVTGTIYSGAASNLTISVSNATDIVTVRFSEAGTVVADVTNVTVTAGSATVAVPAAVYGQSGGDVIAVSVINQDGTPSSNSVNKTIQGLPTGGTITTSGSYRIHTFTTSGNFVVPSGFSATAEYLVVAGGGGGGGAQSSNDCGGGGGGAGGMLTGSTSISAQTYGVTVGAGGSGGGEQTSGSDGNNSSALSVTCIGGGGGASRSAGGGSTTPGSGGSGGGGTCTGLIGSGTSGQGNNGGGGAGTASGGSYGGGGKGSTGNGPNSTGGGGNGGTGEASSISGTSLFYAGGGGGGEGNGPGGRGIGGSGVGGDGSENSNNSPRATDGATNRGGGGGGNGGFCTGTGGAGGSGVVVIRYTI